MRVLSLFSGIGAFEKALERCNIPYELVNYCEIDRYASKAYSIIHNVDESKNLKDVTKIDESALPRDLDLITYGFPCQDISVAGKRKGFTDEHGERTRSGLFFDALRVISETQPKFAIAENVKALTSKRFANEFKTVLTSLELAGYSNYYAVLNAKDYGIPQNRERVFIVSIREDVDTGDFIFPAPFELQTRLKDLLEPEVDEKYYLKDSKQYFINHSLAMEAKGNGFRFAPHVKENADLAKTITTRAGGRMDDNFILDNPQTNESKFTFNKNNVDNLLLVDDTQGFESEPRVYKDYAPTLTCMQGGGLEPKILEDLRIRKLTPKECWRLMGFADEDIDRCAAAGLSNSQLYKMAGNSIVVSCIEEIYKRLFK